MIKVEPCKGCGGPLLVDRFMGLAVRCEVTPLDAQAAGAALLAGQELHRVMYLGGRPSSFSSASPAVLGALRGEPSERPMVVVTHRCPSGATGARQSASQEVAGPGTPATPPKAPVAPSRPSSGSIRPNSPTPATVLTAEPRRSDTPGPSPRCSGCGQPCEDGTYAAIGLGELIVWAHHVEECGS